MDMEAQPPDAIRSKLPEIATLAQRLEAVFGNACDFVFTVQHGELFVEDVRVAPRLSGPATVRTALDLFAKGRVSLSEGLSRIVPADVRGFLRPRVRDGSDLKLLVRGFGRSPGAATGRLAWSMESARDFMERGDPVIYGARLGYTARNELECIWLAEALVILGGCPNDILDAVYLVWNKPWLQVDPDEPVESWMSMLAGQSVSIGGTILGEGDWITIDASTGLLWRGKGFVTQAQWRDCPDLRAAAKSHPELVFAAAENPGSRLAAVQALRFCPDKRACDVLLAALNDDFPPVRHAAAYSLAGSDVSDDVRVVPALIKTCRDRDKTMRIASAHVLAEIVDTRATDVLIELLEDRETRSSAVEGLCRIGGKRVVSSLVPLLSDEPNCFLRRKVGEGLQRCGWVPGCGEERVAYLIAVEDWEGCVAVGSPAKEQLAACLRDGTDEVRRGAAWALERLDWQPRNVVEEVLFLMAARRISEVVERGESVVPPLLTLLDIYCGDDFELVMWTLVQIGEPATRALVAELLRETSLPHVRLGAAKVLSASGFAPENSCQRMWLLAARQQWEECLAMDTCRGEFLQTLMRWSDRVGLKFDETLRQTIGEVASLFLMDVLPEQEPKVNKFVAELFVQTREGHAEEFLRGLLDDPHDAIRNFAAYTLAEKRDERAIEVLLTAVDDGECWPHGLMMVRLGEVAGSDARALDVLLRALQDSNWRTRATAASVLGAVGAVGGERTALALLNALSDPEFGDHAAVAESLATLRESRAVPTLIHIMDDRPYDRWFAAKGLKIITGQEGDWDSSERTAGMQEG